MAAISSTSSSSVVFIPEINSTYTSIPVSTNSTMTEEEFDKERRMWLKTILDRTPQPPPQSKTNKLKNKILVLLKLTRSPVRTQLDKNLEALRNIPEKTLSEMHKEYGNDSRDWPSEIRVLSESFKKPMLIERDKRDFLSFLNRSLEANFLHGFDVTYSEELVKYTYAENFSFLATELLRNKPEEVKFASFAQFLIKAIQHKQNDFSPYRQTLSSRNDHWSRIWSKFLSPNPRHDLAVACVKYLSKTPNYPLSSIYNILRNITEPTNDYDLSYSVLSLLEDPEVEYDSASILRLQDNLRHAENNVMKLEDSIAKQREKNGKCCTIYLDETPELKRARIMLSDQSTSYNKKLSRIKDKTETSARKAFKQKVMDYFRLRTDMLKVYICNTIPPNDSSVVNIINDYLITYPMTISIPRPATSIISPENVTVDIVTTDIAATESPKTPSSNLAESTSLRSVARGPRFHIAPGLERLAPSRHVVPNVRFHVLPTNTAIAPIPAVSFHLSPGLDPAYASLIAQFASITTSNPVLKDRT